MRYHPGHKAESRAKLLKAVGRGFRAAGFGGIGVDGLAKEAQATAGAFYTHFGSKQEAFKEAVVAGLHELRASVLALREEHGENWAEVFTKFYLNAKRTCPLGESCALQSLSSEIERCDAEVRDAYAQAFVEVLNAVADGLPAGTSRQRKEKASALLGLLAGSVTLARSTPDARIGEEIARGATRAALAILRD